MLRVEVVAECPLVVTPIAFGFGGGHSANLTGGWNHPFAEVPFLTGETVPDDGLVEQGHGIMLFWAYVRMISSQDNILESCIWVPKVR